MLVFYINVEFTADWCFTGKLENLL